MSGDTQLLTEIRDLLLVLAEPALAKRDERLRADLKIVVGKGKKPAAAVRLMDGTRTQAAIAKESQMDASNLSKLVKALIAKRLVVDDGKAPNLAVKVPANFFEESE